MLSPTDSPTDAGTWDATPAPGAPGGYPTGDALLTFLRANGLLTGDRLNWALLLDLPGKVAAAAAEFERRVGWFPFLSSGDAAEARLFDAPVQGLVTLDAGLLAVTSVTFAGQTLTVGRGLTLSPANAPRRGRPYTALEFGAPLNAAGYFGGWGAAYGFGFGGLDGFGLLGYGAGGRNALEVTGEWGYCRALPASVSEAVLQRAAALCVPQLSPLLNGTLRSWTEEGATEEYTQDQILKSADGWAATFESAVTLYRRARVA